LVLLVMQKRIIPTCILIAYSAILIRIVVFKIGVIKIGHLRFKFTDRVIGKPNFLPYLRGEHGWFIAVINLVGNIALFVPIGFLTPFVYLKMTWQKSLMLAVAAGLAIEGIEAVFNIGIFDIDDVILNALGVMIGYWVFAMLTKRMRHRLK